MGPCLFQNVILKTVTSPLKIKLKGISTSHTHPALTCSKLTLVTLEQDVKYAQSCDVIGVITGEICDITGVILVSLLLTLNIFQTLF